MRHALDVIRIILLATLLALLPFSLFSQAPGGSSESPGLMQGRDSCGPSPARVSS